MVFFDQKMKKMVITDQSKLSKNNYSAVFINFKASAKFGRYPLFRGQKVNENKAS